MKTTIYELLGMIKDGKAPKKIMFKGFTFEYIEVAKDYKHVGISEYLFDEYVITDILNDEVTILETTITYNQDAENQKNVSYIKQDANMQDNKIEKIEKTVIINCMSIGEQICANKINEIIDKLNGE